jgi:hypothetical protein
LAIGFSEPDFKICQGFSELEFCKNRSEKIKVAAKSSTILILVFSSKLQNASLGSGANGGANGGSGAGGAGPDSGTNGDADGDDGGNNPLVSQLPPVVIPDDPVVQQDCPDDALLRAFSQLNFTRGCGDKFSVDRCRRFTVDVFEDQFDVSLNDGDDVKTTTKCRLSCEHFTNAAWSDILIDTLYGHIDSETKGIIKWHYDWRNANSGTNEVSEFRPDSSPFTDFSNYCAMPIGTTGGVAGDDANAGADDGGSDGDGPGLGWRQI